MTDKKRRFTRFPFKMEAELTVEGTRYKVDKINNLSIGGCLLSIPAEMRTGTPCSLRIILKTTGNEPVVEVDGTIARCQNGNVAIKFTGIDPDNLIHLQNIARYNSPDPDKIEKEIQDHPGLV